MMDGKQQHCVYKQDSEGKPMGEAHGCHMTRREALAQMRALYDVEGKKAAEIIEETGKAAWTQTMQNDLPYSCFLFVEPGGKKDESGKTTPRSKRHLLYKDEEGVDLPHLRNAICRLSQPDTGTTESESWLTESVRKRLLDRKSTRLNSSHQK